MTNEQPKTILVIDDEAHMLVGIKALLQRAGYNTLTASSSQVGITMACEHKPDLIICDIMMPVTDGYKVREILTSSESTRDIPFLFLTARVTQTDKLRGLNAGADDYLTKPFDHRELLARIQAVLRRYERGRQDGMQAVDHQMARIRSEILHNLSHELRTPMTQILMALDMILRNKYKDAEDLKWFAETALSQSQVLNSLIDDLLFLNNHDSQRLVFLRQKIRMEYDFYAPIETLKKRYEDKRINLKVTASPETVVHAPRREFNQAVTHLIDNGMKFSDPGGIVLVHLGANGYGGCILTVTDFGAGIPLELQEKVFERYYQISQGDSRQYNGLGVGLTIARAIARNLGGDVTLLPQEPGCQVQMVIPPGEIDVA